MQDPSYTVYCRNCKTPMSPNVAICPRCRADQRVGPPPQGPSAYPTAQPRRARYDKDRPTGVTIIAILMMLNGLGAIIGSCGMFAIGSMAEGMRNNPQFQQAMQNDPEAAKAFNENPGLAKGAMAAVGVGMLFGAALNIGLSIGLLYMRPWARIAALILNFLGVALCGLALLGSGFNGFLLLSLTVSLGIALYLLTLGAEFADYY